MNGIHSASKHCVCYIAACVVSSDPGPCRAAFWMYYFEPKTQTCQQFIYGGCKGNKNRYSTVEECMSNCAGKDGRRRFYIQIINSINDLIVFK